MTKNNRMLTLSFALTQLFALSAPAFAVRDIEPLNAFRNEIRAQNIKIEGKLSCEEASQNMGGACMLRIRENKSGRTYNLTGNGSKNAMSFLENGTKDVVIEGKLADAETLKVSSVERL